MFGGGKGREENAQGEESEQDQEEAIDRVAQVKSRH